MSLYFVDERVFWMNRSLKDSAWGRLGVVVLVVDVLGSFGRDEEVCESSRRSGLSEVMLCLVSSRIDLFIFDVVLLAVVS